MTTSTQPAFLPADTSYDLVDTTVGGLLAQQAAAHPDRLALVGTSISGQSVRLTYRELYDEACRVASGLSRIASPGDHVALWSPNHVEWPIIEYGAALAGVTLVALNPAFRRAELEYTVAHSGSTVLLHAERVGDDDLAAIAHGLGADFPGLRVVSLTDRSAWRADEIDETVIANAPTDPDSPVMLQYTSGTTGRPKGVLLKHRSLVNVARMTMAFVEVPEAAVCVNPLPMFHTAACVIGTLGPCSIGGTQVLIEKFAPTPVLQTMRTENADVLFYVPAVLGALLEVQRTSDLEPPQLHTVMGGASNVPASMIEAAERVFGASVINLFGQTELAPVLSATRPGDTRDDQLATVGHPLPQVDVKIVDPMTGDVVGLGQPGEICARGYQQLIEYLHDPEATSRAVDREGYLHTGDLGSMDERGYITLTGRLKELIIRGGENIAPTEIETALAAHDAVLAATVVGLPDERLGEIVGVVLTLRGEEPIDLRAQLETFLRERLARFKIPSRWFVSDGLPITPTGKVRKFKVIDHVIDGTYRELV
ncbi:class I adenylate-forming enzyme family protein [Dietzia maris]|uniref:class I adenylate-forming enzyme family protein n=1 Tax=Dietzia maris TaxID=37915 RepID=UPI0037CB0CDB